MLADDIDNMNDTRHRVIIILVLPPGVVCPSNRHAVRGREKEVVIRDYVAVMEVLAGKKSYIVS